MFEQAVRASEAMQRAAQGRQILMPALSGCRTCRTAEVTAAPVLGRCGTCGAELAVLSTAELPGYERLAERAALTA